MESGNLGVWITDRVKLIDLTDSVYGQLRLGAGKKLRKLLRSDLCLSSQAIIEEATLVEFLN